MLRMYFPWCQYTVSLTTHAWWGLHPVTFFVTDDQSSIVHRHSNIRKFHWIASVCGCHFLYRYVSGSFHLYRNLASFYTGTVASLYNYGYYRNQLCSIRRYVATLYRILFWHRGVEYTHYAAVLIIMSYDIDIYKASPLKLHQRRQTGFCSYFTKTVSVWTNIKYYPPSL